MKNLEEIIEEEDLLELTLLIANYDKASVDDHKELKEVMIYGWVPDKKWVRIVDVNNEGLMSNERWVKAVEWAVIYASKENQ